MTSSIVFKSFNRRDYTREFFSALCGKKLGRGAFREVYRCRFDPKIVFKFELEDSTFSNVKEWEMWKTVKYTRFAKWFAPCIEISCHGGVLIQSYAKNIAKADLPTKVPPFFTDLKVENWGLYQGHPVARDYGNHLALDRGLGGAMKKPHWYKDTATSN